jgi:site-specific recombinase XerC
VTRHLEQLRAQAEADAQRQLPPGLAQLIDTYESRLLPGPHIHAARPLIRQVALACGLTSEHTVRDYRTHLAGLCAYGVSRGKQLTAEQLLTTEFIDEYVRLGMAGEEDRLRARRRSLLLAMARAANPGPTAPAKLPAIQHAAVRPPYAPQELAIIVRVCAGQPTDRLVRDLSAVVGLGAGAGLDSMDLRDLRIGNIVDEGEAGLLVHVPDPRPRTVPVRARAEHLVRRAAKDRDPDELVIGAKRDRRNIAFHILERAVLFEVPHIEPARLRATWLADLMTDQVPIGVLMQAAGLKSARTLADLLPHLQPWLEHKQPAAGSEAMLRGGAR